MNDATLNERGADRLLRVRECVDCDKRIGRRNKSGRCHPCCARYNLIHYAIPANPPSLRSATATRTHARKTPKERTAFARNMQASMTPEVRSRIGRLGCAASWAGTSPDERRERMSTVLKRNANMSPEERSAIAKKANATMLANRRRNTESTEGIPDEETA